MIEEWKIYKDTRFKDNGKINPNGYLWEVSNYGNIKRNGEEYIPNVRKNKRINLCGEGVHRIVGKLFIPNPENKSEIDHIDTNPLNNNVENLRWVTPKENMNNPLTKEKMKTHKYKYIVTFLDNQYEFYTQKEIVERLGISQGTVSNALNKKHKTIIKIDKVKI